MDVAVAVLALLFVLFVVSGAIAAVKTTRAVKRGVQRTVTDTRKTVEETALKARRAVQPGPVGDIAGLRLSLRTSIDSTRRELEHAVTADPGLHESVGLLDRLQEYAQQVDAELRHLEREPDKARIKERLPELRSRAERIRHSADSLRWAAQDRARHAAADPGGLEALTSQIDLETGALRHWTPATEEQSGGTGQPSSAASSGASSASPSVSSSASSSASSSGTRPSAGGPKEPRPAISSGDRDGGQDAFQALLAKIEKLRKPESA